MDLEDPERDDVCQICYDAVSSVRFGECDHAMCSQCVYTMLTKNHELKCPFCRTTVTSVTEVNPLA